MDFLSNDDINKLHSATLKLLEKTGIGVHHDDALKLLGSNGAYIDHKKHIARIPESLIKEALKQAPRKFQIIGSDKKTGITLGAEETYFATQNAAFLEDPKTGKFVEPTMNLTENFVRLADFLENINVVFTPGIRDVHPLLMDAYEFLTLACNTRKPFEVTCYRDVGSVETYIDMAEIVLGSKDEFLKNPLFLTGPGIVSPLLRTKEHMETFMAMAKNGIPLLLAGQPVSGGTSPVTLAGSIVVGNAEIISGIVLAQLIRKNTPVVYLEISYPMDMRTGIAATGSPERALLNFISPQMARFYNIPGSVIFNTDAHIFDAQVGYEKGLSVLPSLLSNAKLVWGIGGMGKSVSFTQAVIDNEIVNLAKRIVSGIKISPESIALDVIDEVGIGANYLSHGHTRTHFKREIYRPEISNRLVKGAWEKAGSEDVSHKARKKVLDIIKSHKPDPIDKDIKRDLLKYIESKKSVLLKKGK